MHASTRNVAAFSSHADCYGRANRNPISRKAYAVRVVPRAVTSAAPATLTTLTAKGATFSKAELSSSLEDGKPMLVAESNISAGEQILSIPDSLWLTQEAVQKSAIGKAVDGQEPWTQLALLALVDSGEPATQLVIPPFPGESESPLFWSSEELAELEGTQLLESTRSYMQFFISKYEELQSTLFASNPALFPPSKVSFQRFLWAVASVRSRTHPPLEGADIALVPGIDLVKHSKGCSNQLKVVKGGFLGRSRSLVLEAGRAIRKGETITMDYAPERLDSQVLLDYGVRAAGSNLAGFQLAVSVPDSDRNLVDKLDILRDLGLGQSVNFTLMPNEAPSDDMMAFLRLVQLCKMDSFLLESIFRQEVWGHMSLPVSDFNEGLVCESMIAGAKEALAAYPTTIDQDLALLRTKTVEKGSRLETAVLVRLGEKEALDSALRWFEARQLDLKQLEYYQDRRLKRLGLLDDKGRSTFDSFFKDSIA